MSRFHDEFFRQGSPAHDALMIKSVSSDGIKKIIESIDLSKKIDNAPYTDTIIECDLINEKHAYWDLSSDNAPRPIRSSEGELFCSHKDDCLYRMICDFNERRPHTKKVKKVPRLSDYKTQVLGYETEVIVRGGNAFILGYADAIVRLNFVVPVDAIVEAGRTEKDFCIYNQRADILIEAKPVLDSIGEVIRQIKTYRERLLRGSMINASVITTYSHLSEDALNYLKNEDINVVVFEECK